MDTGCKNHVHQRQIDRAAKTGKLTGKLTEQFHTRNKHTWMDTEKGKNYTDPEGPKKENIRINYW